MKRDSTNDRNMDQSPHHNFNNIVESRRGTLFEGSNRIGSSQHVGSDQHNLWKSILNDVAQRDDVKESHLLVLGDKGAGKRSLI